MLFQLLPFLMLLSALYIIIGFLFYFILIVWECKPAKRYLIIKRVTEYVLKRHLSLAEDKIMHALDQLDFSLVCDGEGIEKNYFICHSHLSCSLERHYIFLNAVLGYKVIEIHHVIQIRLLMKVCSKVLRLYLSVYVFLVTFH